MDRGEVNVYAQAGGNRLRHAASVVIFTGVGTSLLPSSTRGEAYIGLDVLFFYLGGGLCNGIADKSVHRQGSARRAVQRSRSSMARLGGCHRLRFNRPSSNLRDLLNLGPLH